VTLAEFDYELPAERIAQHPADRRDASRLLVLDRSTGVTDHRTFSAVSSLFAAGDLLVLNDTRVRPARLIGRKASGGKLELLLTEVLERGVDTCEWRCLMQVSRPPAIGSSIELDSGPSGHVVSRQGEGWRVRFDVAAEEVEEYMERSGEIPLPPYIHRTPDETRSDEDRERYQTVFAARSGAVAAPTAGLHFTVGLLDRLRAQGVRTVTLTLHVGPGTFLPVRSERIEEHRMHAEPFELGEEVVAAVDETRARGGRVVAAGTTVVRTLETRAAEGGRVRAGAGHTDLFIRPGFEFGVIDAMITNFHLPRSTLLMLVSAFAGREAVLAAYREAVEAEYRFFSYGDAMWIG